MRQVQPFGGGLKFQNPNKSRVEGQSSLVGIHRQPVWFRSSRSGVYFGCLNSRIGSPWPCEQIPGPGSVRTISGQQTLLRDVWSFQEISAFCTTLLKYKSFQLRCDNSTVVFFFTSTKVTKFPKSLHDDLAGSSMVQKESYNSLYSLWTCRQFVSVEILFVASPMEWKLNPTVL